MSYKEQGRNVKVSTSKPMQENNYSESNNKHLFSTVWLSFISKNIKRADNNFRRNLKNNNLIFSHHYSCIDVLLNVLRTYSLRCEYCKLFGRLCSRLLFFIPPCRYPQNWTLLSQMNVYTIIQHNLHYLSVCFVRMVWSTQFLLRIRRSYMLFFKFNLNNNMYND